MPSKHRDINVLMPFFSEDNGESLLSMASDDADLAEVEFDDKSYEWCDIKILGISSYPVMMPLIRVAYRHNNYMNTVYISKYGDKWISAVSASGMMVWVTKPKMVNSLGKQSISTGMLPQINKIMQDWISED